MVRLLSETNILPSLIIVFTHSQTERRFGSDATICVSYWRCTYFLPLVSLQSTTYQNTSFERDSQPRPEEINPWYTKIDINMNFKVEMMWYWGLRTVSMRKDLQGVPRCVYDGDLNEKLLIPEVEATSPERVDSNS